MNALKTAIAKGHGLLGSAALVVALATALPATAAIVTVDFTITGVGSGSYQYDDATATTNLFGETEYALTGFNLDLGGSSFDLSNLDYGTAIFSGGVLQGLDAYEKTGAFAFTPGAGGGFAGATGRGTGTGEVVFEDPRSSVPEPAAWALGLAALGAAGWARRRQQRRG